jgi:hypothetical protein
MCPLSLSLSVCLSLSLSVSLCLSLHLPLSYHRPCDDGDCIGSVTSPGAVLHVTGLDPSRAWLQVDLDGATAWLKREVSAVHVHTYIHVCIDLSLCLFFYLCLSVASLLHSPINFYVYYEDA